jgi:MFS family permease
MIAAVCQVLKATAAIALALGTLGGWLSREVIFAILFVAGTARAFEVPTMHALVPSLVPQALLPRAIAASASANQTAIICGPAIGGFLYVFGPATVYLTCVAVFVTAAALVLSVLVAPHTTDKKPVSLSTLLAGFSYIWSRPVLLGAISLDLFAVLLGGVTALLPVYVRDILEAGPWALGLLRTAPAVGALAAALLLARRAIEARAGHIMFGAVGVFGLASILFGLSTSLVLSFAALMLYGAADAVSVVIRQSLIQLRTPTDMLGRVMAVNSLCTGSSGTLGEFRAGVVAASFGVVPAALIGGLGIIAVMLVWMWAFPQLRRVDRLAGEG